MTNDDDTIYFDKEVFSQLTKHNLPRTVDQAVELLFKLIPESERKKVLQRNCAEHHFGLGLWIRNKFNLWGDNRLMLGRDTGENHPDLASGVIISVFLHSLQHGNGEEGYMASWIKHLKDDYGFEWKNEWESDWERRKRYMRNQPVQPKEIAHSFGEFSRRIKSG